MPNPSTLHPLERDLQDIATGLVRMLSWVRESTELARRAFLRGDPGATEQCIANDIRIDQLQITLEQDIIQVIAMRQPKARDVRFLSAAHHALVDIERAGDYAVHIARSGQSLTQELAMKKPRDTRHIFIILNQMIETTIKALAEANHTAALATHAMDSGIDDLYDQLQRQLLTYMLENPQHISQAMELFVVMRSLDHLGDHLENVNEQIIGSPTDVMMSCSSG